MAMIRQSGMPIDLFAATPKMNESKPYDYDSALRRRLDPINAIGVQQNQFANEQAAKAAQARWQAMFNALGQSRQQMQAQQQAAMAGGFNGNPAQTGWVSPIKGMMPTFGYGAKYKTPVAGHQYHQGIDFAVKPGTQVFAPYNGRIISAGPESGGFGTAARIDFGGGLVGILGHLASVALQKGDLVTAGQLLGLSGNTGFTTGPHTHFELQRNGQAINPMPFFGWN